MLKSLLVVAFFMVGGLVHAEEKTCAVKGMHCADCASTVQEKVCDPSKYSTCDVKLTNEKQSMGEIHLITKDSKAKIDEPTISSLIKDSGYSLEKCSNGKAHKAS